MHFLLHMYGEGTHLNNRSSHMPARVYALAVAAISVAIVPTKGVRLLEEGTIKGSCEIKRADMCLRVWCASVFAEAVLSRSSELRPQAQSRATLRR